MNVNDKLYRAADEVLQWLQQPTSGRSYRYYVSTITLFKHNGISGNNIDGSMIPYIIGQTMPDRQNFIVSRDPYETQYFFEDNFTHHLYIRGYSKSSLSWNMRGYLKDISTLESISDDEVELFESNRSFYLLFLACAGEKYRSIDGLRGIGLRSIYKYIKDAIDCNRITQDTSSIELLSKIFNGKKERALLTSYYLFRSLKE